MDLGKLSNDRVDVTFSQMLFASTSTLSSLETLDFPIALFTIVMINLFTSILFLRSFIIAMRMIERVKCRMISVYISLTRLNKFRRQGYWWSNNCHSNPRCVDGVTVHMLVRRLFHASQFRSKVGVTDESFSSVLKSSTPHLVDFYAK